MGFYRCYDGFLKKALTRLLFILTILFPAFLYGQTFDSIKVSDSLSGEIYINCKTNHERIKLDERGQQIYSKEDSLNNCTLTKTYKTNHKDIYYIKEFNLFGQLQDEGFAKAVWRNRKFLGIKLKPKTFSLVKFTSTNKNIYYEFTITIYSKDEEASVDDFKFIINPPLKRSNIIYYKDDSTKRFLADSTFHKVSLEQLDTIFSLTNNLFIRENKPEKTDSTKFRVPCIIYDGPSPIITFDLGDCKAKMTLELIYDNDDNYVRLIKYLKKIINAP